MAGLKRLLLKSLLLPGVVAPFSRLMKGRAVVFMLHRFREPSLCVEGHDPALLRRVLAHLRKKRYNLLSLQELFRLLADGETLSRVVVFTIDDGYLDHATVAAPVFAEFDCPVTTFVTTGFLDGHLWFWWDQIACIFAHTLRRELRLVLGETELHYSWTDEDARRRAQEDFAVRCTDVPDVERLEGIRCLVAEAEVEPPRQPPPCFAPMSWEQARACERGGMSFGPHTVTHPVLSRTSDEQSAGEIAGSWERLRSEVQHPVPIFCFPNGRLVDFGEREITVLKRLGFMGAVTGLSEYASVGSFRASSEAPYRLPRLGYPDTFSRVIQCVSGFERFKRLMRGMES